jgi:hypothetical protein
MRAGDRMSSFGNRGAAGLIFPQIPVEKPSAMALTPGA